jgi:glycosyltransferase involved in cell wall biosynthesis
MPDTPEKPRRRILLLITDLEIGGTPTVVRELATRLNDPPNVVVEVACLKPWGPVADQLRDAGIEVTAFDARRPWSLLRTVKRLRRHVEEKRFDAVLSFLVHANAIAAMALKRLPHVRLIQSIQTTQPHPRWHWRLQGLVQARAERIVVPSRAIVAAAGERSGIPAGRFVVIPNAIDPDAFPRANVFRGDITRAGFLGRIDPVKRVSVAIRAADLVRDLPARLFIFGGGPGAAALAGELDKYAGVVHYVGPVAHPREAFAQIDLLMLPSIGEGFGLVLIEAMAAGVPVVASAAGAIPEIVRHEQNGLLVDVSPHDAEGFAAAIRRLKQDDALRDRLIANALADVRWHYTWDIVLPQYQALLGIDG